MRYNFTLQYAATEIPSLATRYLVTPYRNWTVGDEDRVAEEAGERLVNDPTDLESVKAIVKWKSPRRMDRFILNSAEKVEAAVREAIEATKTGDVRRAVKALTKLAGVKVKMASAILTAMFPKLYTVCDFRASSALGQQDFSSMRYYVEYLAECRTMAHQHGVSLRNFDRANWQWSKEQSKKTKKNSKGWNDWCCKNERAAELHAFTSASSQIPAYHA